MTLVHPWILALALIPIGWVLYVWRSTPRLSLLLLKAASILAIVAALAEPVFHYDGQKVAVAVLADTSASVTPEDLEAATRTVAAIENRRGSNAVVVMPFARSTRPFATAKLDYAGGDAGNATNLEAAIRDGIAALPAAAIRRVALITDGNENSGSVARAAWQAQQLGIPIDTFPLAGHARPNLRVESVSVPEEVFTGERFPVELTVTSPRSLDAQIDLEADGRKLGSQPVTLQPGENLVVVRASVNTTGAIVLSGSVSAKEEGRAPFAYAATVRHPRVLLLSEDPPGADDHLLQILAANQFNVDHANADRGAGQLPPDLDQYQIVIYNNWDKGAIPLAEQTRLENFERQGGGLLWIAGEKNVYVDPKGKPEEPLARALPAKLAPPRTPEGTCVILIIDKSSSMEGPKMDLARLASIGVVDNLKPQDYVAVLIFDNSFQWAVPLRKAEDRAVIKRLISGITPDGGTQIAPALAEAFRKIVPVNAVYKHIVLLTDGISEEGDSLTLARDAAASHVTISTVGLGQDVNRAYLEKIASNANGKSYFLLEPNGLEQILLKDVKEHTGTTAVEKPLKPEMKTNADLLQGVDIASAPALEGYVRFETRPDAEEILSMDRDPLLVRWQYGLGRSAVFTSDAKNRWAAAWLGWKDFDRFWTNVIRDLLPSTSSSEASSQYDPASQEVVVNYRLSRQVEEPEKPPDIFALGPGQFRRAAEVTRIAKGVYRARVRIGDAQGMFRIRPLAESRAFPEIGFYRNEAEMSDFGTNTSLLKQLSASTGGRYAPAPKQVFDAGGRSTPASLRLWPGLLAVAIVLNFAELLARKWKGLREWLPSRAPAAA